METLFVVVLLTLAIRAAAEKGRAEYSASRDRYAKELRKQHPNWSKDKAERRAERMARGYWWDQVRRGFPDTKNAYREARQLAEAERLEAERDGLRRRKEIRERMAKAIAEAEELRKQEWEAYRSGDRRYPDPPYWGDGRRKKVPAPDDTTAGPAPDPGTAAGETPRGARPPEVPAPPPQPVDWPEGKTLIVRSKSGRPIDRLTGASEWSGAVYTDEDLQRRIALIDQDPDLSYEVKDPRNPRDASVPRSPDEGPDDDPGSGSRPAPQDDSNVVPIGRSGTDRHGQPSPATHGGPTVSTNMTGEVNGYEQTLADMNDDIEHLTGLVDIYDKGLPRLQEDIEDAETADAAYEKRIGVMRGLNVDEETIADQVRLREQNEKYLAALRENIEKASAGAESARNRLLAATEARDNWVSRHGAVKDVKGATGAHGDEALYA